MTENKHVWEGEIYVRPLNRGVCLAGGNMPHIEEWIAKIIGADSYSGNTTHRVRITVETLEEIDDDT